MTNKNVLAFDTFECSNKSNSFTMTYLTDECANGPRITTTLDGLKFIFTDIQSTKNPLFTEISAFDTSMNTISFNLQHWLTESQLAVIMKAHTYTVNCVGINSTY